MKRETDNPWGTVPLFHFANEADTGDLGVSELKDVIPLQDSLNKVLSDLILACESIGFPQKVILGLDSGDPGVTEGLQRLQAGMNKIFTIPYDGTGDKPTIDEFSAGNLVQLIQTSDHFDTLISRVSSVPVHYLQQNGGFPSGRAMRTAEAPRVSKSEDQQTFLGNVWEDAMHLGLRMTGVADPGMLTAVWKSAAPLSLEDMMDVAMQMSAAGFPFEEILRYLGRDEEEITRIMDEKNAAAERFDVDLTGIGADDEDERGAAA